MEGGGADHQPSDSTDGAETSGAAAAPPPESAPPEATTSLPPEVMALAPPDQATTSLPPEVMALAPPDQATTSAPTLNKTLSYDERFVQYDHSGTTFDLTAKYETPVSKIGEGGYGILWSVMNSETGERVAIKKIARAFDNKAIAKKTLREILILRRMKHDNIIVIRDIIPPQSRRRFNDVYIAYELMDYDLEHVIYSHLLEVQKKYFLYQILRGLKYIHSANVLHRDIKPSNLLIKANCDLKICDFGLARIGSQSRMTSDVGSSWYRAPELLLNSSHYTSAVDIWSVGCVFMEMHIRKILFQGRDFFHQLELIMQLIGTPNEADLGFANEGAKWYINILPHFAPQSFAEVFPQVPGAAIDLAEKMLKIDPRQRITAEEALAHPYLAFWHDVKDDPVCTTPLSFDFEEDAAFSVEQAKEIIHEEALTMNPDYRI